MNSPSVRFLVSVALSLAVFFAGTSIVAAQTADEVIDKHLAAIGGRDALSKLQSRITTGAITVSTPGGDVTGTIETYNKAPNKSRSYLKLDLSAFGMGELVRDQRFDGTAGYVIDTMNGNQDMAGSQLEGMKNSYFPTPLLKYKELETKAEITGKEKVGDRDVYVLVTTPKSGPSSKIFLDAESYLPLKSLVKINVPQMRGDVEQTTEFGDYREVDGVKLPFEIKVSNSAQTFVIKASKVEHNKEIDDKNFVKPEAGK